MDFPIWCARKSLASETNATGLSPTYHKVTKFPDPSQEDANGIANSEDPDQTAPLGAV